MDNSFTIKPPASVPTKYLTRSPAAAREPVETELDASKTVAALGEGSAENHDRRHDHPPQDVVADPASREVINRENDIRAQLDTREHPDQALLRQRAYRPAPRETEIPAAGETHANIKA